MNLLFVYNNVFQAIHSAQKKKVNTPGGANKFSHYIVRQFLKLELRP